MTTTRTTHRPPREDRPQAPPPAARPRWTAALLRRRATPFGYLSPTIVLMVVLMAVPIVMVISYSVMDNVITNRSPEPVGLANYGTILGDPAFWKAATNTLAFTSVSVVVHLVLGLTFAILLNTELLGKVTKAVFRVILVLPWLFTVAIIAVLWRMLLSPNGVVNAILESVGLIGGEVEWLSNPTTALAAVTFINIWAGYPFYMISLLAGLQGIPRDLYEAASIDGAGPVQRFWAITIPQLKPLIISLALLDFIWTTQQFALIWMTTGGGPIDATEVLSTFTYKLAFTRYEFAEASTAAVIILAFSMVLAYFYARSQRARD
ncbi:carbohydrate ABC transporter permease [Serinibacter arcticus]|uniref:Putative alpha-xyloside ABC transporter, permease component n=1 Tax=Serinibacter arcticus TaxID=1655435 RepID=A0A4Z1E8R2_9MICO|nr:sugar ABC transporter permease [Serinibacter arcticus]TGO05967.1 putative alpha-xyloside ABC transporter, permease component [Serinibacter arcticus]